MSTPWELTIVDADPGQAQELGSLALGDLEADGHQGIVTGGNGSLLWYRPVTGERGLIAAGAFGVGLALEDGDGDGRREVVTAQETGGPQRVVWFRPEGSLDGAWQRHVIDDACDGSAHDLLFADLDGDGRPEVIAGEHDPFWPYRTRNRLLVYQAADAKARAWQRCVVDDRFEHHDGTKVIGLGNGRVGIMSHGWTDSHYVHLWEVVP